MEGKTELERNAIVEARRKDLAVYQRAMDIEWLNNRMEDSRMGQVLALVGREAEMEKDFHERTDHAAIVNKQAEKEAALGMEISKVRQEDACQLLRRHYLRQRDPHLRELMTKLQAGYVCRDLRQQILHNEYRRLQDKVEEQHANKVLCNALYNDMEAMEREEKVKMEKNITYTKELQQQLVNRQRQKQCQYEEMLIEKKMLDEIMRTLSDEDKREVEQNRIMKQKICQEMLNSQQAREAWKQKQKQVVVNEEIEIEKQQRAAGDRSAAIVAERERKMRIVEEKSNKIAEKILADQAVRQEREDIIKLLQEQEYLEQNFQQDKSEKEKLEQSKKDTKEALTAQMENRKKLEVEQKKREAEFRIISEAKMAAEIEKEREKERKVREKNRNYSKELLKQIEDNSQRRNRDRADEENRAKHVFECDRKWQEEVQGERKKIIEEHVPNLLGYLQAGVIKKDDLPTVRAGANRDPELAKLDIEAMALRKGTYRFPKCNPQCMILREY